MSNTGGLGMEHFRGNILDNDQILLENVEGVLHVATSPDGWSNWAGSFDVPAYNSIELGGPYRLQLEDGRHGKIGITEQKQTSTEAGCTVEFKGRGPLKKG
jgi:hypothetical protein